MKTTMKKVLSMTLALVLLLGVLPMTALATEPDHVHFDGNGNGYCDGQNCPGKTSDMCTEHTVGTAATCQTKAVCSTCHWYFGDLGDHTGGTATCQAKAVCETCSQPYGNTLPHTVGTTGTAATCMSEAICGTCGEKYGVVNSNNHVGAGAGDWLGDASNHWKNCVCGKAVDQNTVAAHNWVNGVCDGCGKQGTVTVLVRVHEAGTDGQKNGGSFTVNAGNGVSVAGIKTAYHGSSAAQYVPAKIQSYCVTVNGAKSYPNDSVDVTPADECILWLEVPAAEDPSQGGQTGGNTGNGTTGGNTTEKYTVYYNVNVNNPASAWLYDYEQGTFMSTVLADLNKKTITYPGPGTPDWFYIEGWYKDKACTVKVDPASTVTENTTLYAKWLQKQRYEVTVWLCTNGNFSNAVPVDAFYFAQDGWITQSEVENIANNKFKAGNSAGLTIYGPFDAAGWENYRYYNNRLNASKQIQIDTTKENNIYAMVHNVEIYSSSSTSGSKADSTNPKTGDMIMMPAAVLGLSASALAVMFYLKKKRAY